MGRRLVSLVLPLQQHTGLFSFALKLAPFIEGCQLPSPEKFYATQIGSSRPKPFRSLNAHIVAEIVEVPSRVSSLCNDLRHPVRLPILVALSEDEELSATELARRLGSTYNAVAYALDRLVKAGYVEVARVEVLNTVPGNTVQRLYRGRGDDWRRLVGVLDEYARGN